MFGLPFEYLFVDLQSSGPLGVKRLLVHDRSVADVA